MTTNELSTIDDATLDTIHGGMIPVGGGGGGGTPNLILGQWSHLGTLGKPSKPPHCEKWKTWNAPHGTAVTEGGGLVQVPFASCAAIKRAPVPKFHV